MSTKKYDADIVGWMTRGGKRIPLRESDDKKYYSPYRERTIRRNEPLKNVYRNDEESARQGRMNRHMKAYEEAEVEMDNAYDENNDCDEKAWDKAKRKFDENVKAYNEEDANRWLKYEYGDDRRYKKHREKADVKKRIAKRLREEFAD